MDESVFNPRAKVKRRNMAYGPLTLVLLFLAAILVMSLFFRVDQVEVVNASDYTDEEIITASGIEKGANLFFVDRFSAASMIFSDLPYMDTVSITRELPDKIIIQAEGSAPAVYMVIDGEYWFVARNGKTLGITNDLEAAGYPELRNLEPLAAMEGTEMMVEGVNVQRLEYATQLIEALQGEGLLSQVTWIDVKDASDPSLSYEGRLTVYLGAMEEIPMKVALLKDAVSQLGADDTGILTYTGGSAWGFSPD